MSVGVTRKVTGARSGIFALSVPRNESVADGPVGITCVQEKVPELDVEEQAVLPFRVTTTRLPSKPVPLKIAAVPTGRSPGSQRAGR